MGFCENLFFNGAFSADFRAFWRFNLKCFAFLNVSERYYSQLELSAQKSSIIFRIRHTVIQCPSYSLTKIPCKLHNSQAKDGDQKEAWVREVKRCIIDSTPGLTEEMKETLLQKLPSLNDHSQQIDKIWKGIKGFKKRGKLISTLLILKPEMICACSIILMIIS